MKVLRQSLANPLANSSAKFGATTIGAIAEYVNGLGFKESDWGTKGLPIIRIQNLTNPEKTFNYTQRKVETRHVVNAGDILVSWAATLDAFIWQGEKALLNQHIFKVVPNENVVDKRYLFYVLKWAIAEMVKSEHMHGSTMKHINRAPFLAFKIPLPNLKAQKKIAEEIDTNLTLLDAGMAALKRVQAQLKRYRAAVLKAACEGKLVETEGKAMDNSAPFPDGWTPTTLGEIAECVGGLTKNGKRGKFGNKLPYLRVANVYANELRLEEIEYIGVQKSEIERYRLQKGDLLIVEGNGSKSQIGRLATWDGSIEPCLHQNHLIRARPKNGVFAGWIQCWFQSMQGRISIEKVAASTSGLYTLSVNKVKSLPIVMPPEKEQIRIVAEVEKNLGSANKMAEALTGNTQRISVLRTAILSNAFNTKRVVGTNLNLEKA